MSSMDGLRSQLAELKEELRDVVGRLNALEGTAPKAQTKVPVTVTPTEVKAQPASPIAKTPTGTGDVVTRKS